MQHNNNKNVTWEDVILSSEAKIAHISPTPDVCDEPVYFVMIVDEFTTIRYMGHMLEQDVRQMLRSVGVAIPEGLISGSFDLKSTIPFY